ncbi:MULTISPECIES: hypothetical protein [Gardnerella]|uniref:hypothetical protein n=1 Tax=unclassified Gardnerella TaxID=2628112 RepID=UPI000E39222A|nr:hypothetical protein AXE72_03095 [Gardnerella vaginalis]
MAISEIPINEDKAKRVEKEKWYSKVYKRIKKIFTSQKTEEEDQCHYPIVIKFSPWNYSDKNNLISLFFYELKNKLGVAKGEGHKLCILMHPIRWTVKREMKKLSYMQKIYYYMYEKLRPYDNKYMDKTIK